ncbi:MAG: TIM barrel protein [Rhodospirillaceae bacterium]
MSSGAFRTNTISDIIQDALRLNVSHVELSSSLQHDPNYVTSIQLGLDSGLHFLIHNYFPAPAKPAVLNLSATTQENLDWSISHCKTAIDLTVLVDCPFYSLHAGYAAPLTASLLGKPKEQAAAMKEISIDRERAYGTMLNSVQDIADYAKQHGKLLLIENNVISPMYLNELPENPLLMTDADEIEQFMSDINRSNVSFLIDVGHARVSATALGFSPYEFMERTKPFTSALHLSDNDGKEDQNLAYSANSWFWELLEHYQDIPHVIEAYALSDEEMKRSLSLSF